MDDERIMERDWQGYRWTAWMPLMAAHPLALAQLPSTAGLYRVRRAGADRLTGIWWAEYGVREVVERLSRQVHLPVEPYDDPLGPALLLWRLRRDAGCAFEVSGAAVAPGADSDTLVTALRRFTAGASGG